MYTTVSHSEKRAGNKHQDLGVFNSINKWIKKEEQNYFGLCALFLGLGTGLASIPVAIAISLNMFIISTICVVLAMSGIVTVISQQPFKTVVWTFLIGGTINSILMIYLTWLSFF